MLNVLLIDDNEINRDLISRYLDLFGCGVTIALDGPSGLDAARSVRAGLDAILLDMNLPVVDGWEVARLLKADDATKTIPIIALTAHAMIGDREKALRAGCDEFVTKPVGFDELLGKIAILTKKGASR